MVFFLEIECDKIKAEITGPLEEFGVSFDPEMVKECSRMAAREASAGGVQVTFTSMVDYARDAKWGRVMETCLIRR